MRLECHRDRIMVPGIGHIPANAIIAALPGPEGRRFAGLCRSIRLSQGEILCESNQPLKTAYFPASGVIALATSLGERAPLQLGLIGRDGLLGATLALDIRISPMHARVQVAGTALAMPAPQLQQELQTNPWLRQAVHHYQFRLTLQMLQNAVCLHFHEIEPRLARWLLMVCDLSDSDRFHFTQQLLSQALGVRRSGVTLAAGSLQRRGFIRYARGEIQITDYAGLEAAACECHADLTNNYRAVFGSEHSEAPVVVY